MKWNSNVMPSYWVNQLSAVALVALSGCATTPQDCDPGNQDAGILSKAGCVYGGHYQQRIDDKQAILLDEQKANQLFQAAYDSLQLESNQVSSNLAAQQASLERTRSSVTALLGELKSASAGNQQLEQQIQEIESQLQTMQQTLDQAEAANQAIPVLQQRQQTAELQVQVQDLQAALNLR